MGYQRFDQASAGGVRHWQPPTVKEILVHVGLIILTLATCTMAGTAWAMKNPLEIANWSAGLSYAILAMSFLLAHEYGHYIAAMRHGISSSLPYLIPVPPTLMPFGTFGALIRTRSPMMTRNELFDVGVSGPLAGFAACLVILITGFMTLPPQDYLLSIHPEYAVTGIPTGGLTFDNTLLFELLRWLYADRAFVPPMNEIYHYPFLCVGWFGLFVTALNLLPLGQLDGGHVLYGLIGKRQHAVARTIWWVMFLLGMLSLLGTIRVMYDAPSPMPFVVWIQHTVFPSLDTLIHLAPNLFTIGEGWLLWALLIRFLVRIPHPPVSDERPLDRRRQIIGWGAMLLLILCLPPRTIYFIE